MSSPGGRLRQRHLHERPRRAPLMVSAGGGGPPDERSPVRHAALARRSAVGKPRNACGAGAPAPRPTARPPRTRAARLRLVQLEDTRRDEDPGRRCQDLAAEPRNLPELRRRPHRGPPAPAALWRMALERSASTAKLAGLGGCWGRRLCHGGSSPRDRLHRVHGGQVHHGPPPPDPMAPLGGVEPRPDLRSPGPGASACPSHRRRRSGAGEARTSPSHRGRRDAVAGGLAGNTVPR